ncbi:FliH/SctL family protein [Natroniella sp. ANB-PHB2]|uniref:FliH/SctL family protein n=1 Tax=Natroniella sp. ANB-PHB2 TaxID=3384444 RepID=UPI0038D3CCA5
MLAEKREEVSVAKAEVIKETDDILEEAEIKAEKIIQQAQQEAEDLKKEIQQEAEIEFEQKFEQAKEEGYQQGLKLGKQEGVKLGQQQISEELKALVGNLKKEVELYQQDLAKRLPQLKDKLFRLVIKISEKVIGKQLESKPELIKKFVETGLEYLDYEEQVRIKVNPKDLERLAQYQKELLKANNGLEEVKVITDKSIEIGGCIIETDFGGVDLTISSQLKEIESKLLEVSHNE